MSTDQANGPAVQFVASKEFIEALDSAAGKLGQTRSHFARHLLAQHLRATGILDPDAPITAHEARRSRSRPGATV